jgi:undecaprenyl-diphosphatase
MRSRTSAGARSRLSAGGRPPSADPTLTAAQALALGALHGPAELLPISSSAHTSVVPWLLGWDYGSLQPELRKSFEVTLHAGTVVALLISLRSELSDRRDRPRPLVVGLACVPPAIAG